MRPLPSSPQLMPTIAQFAIFIASLNYGSIFIPSTYFFNRPIIKWFFLQEKQKVDISIIISANSLPFAIIYGAVCLSLTEKAASLAGSRFAFTAPPGRS